MAEIRNLYIGCRGADVKTLQTNLSTLGYYRGDIDGIFGTITDNAVKTLQTECGLYADGIVGPKTRAVISAKLKSPGSNVIQMSTPEITSEGIAKEIGRWNGHKFVVSPTQIYSFSDLSVKGSCELADKSDSEQGFVARKGGNPLEVTFTVELNAFVGCPVRQEAYSLCEEAYYGKTDYLYIGNQKISPTMLMLTNANVKDITIASDGVTWATAKVTLTMKQSYGQTIANSGDGGDGGSSKLSTQSGSPVTSYTQNPVEQAASTVVAGGALSLVTGAAALAAAQKQKQDRVLNDYTAQTTVLKKDAQAASQNKKITVNNVLKTNTRRVLSTEK